MGQSNGCGTGAALVAHGGIDKVSFTGSTEVGKKIVAGSVSNLKRVSLELGGKSANIVFADANLKRAARGAAGGVFYNQGQICISGSRILVERGVHDQFAEMLAAFGASADPSYKGDDIASLIAANGAKRMNVVVGS